MLTFRMCYANIREPILALSARTLANIKCSFSEINYACIRSKVSEVIENSDLPSGHKDIFLAAFDNIPKVHAALKNDEPLKDIESTYEPIDILIKHIITVLRTADAIVCELYETDVLTFGIGDQSLINSIDNQDITIILDNLETQLTNIELCIQLFDLFILKPLSKSMCYLDKLFDTIMQLGFELQCMRITILSDIENVNDNFKLLYINFCLDPYDDKVANGDESLFNIEVALTKHYKYIQDIFTDRTAPRDLQIVEINLDRTYDW